MSRCRSTLLVALFSAGSLFAAKQFEGKVAYRADVKGENLSIDYIIKKKRVRLNVRSERGEVSILMDESKRKAIILLPAAHTYIERAMPKPTGRSGRGGALERSGKTEIIAGRACEIWTSTDGGKEGRYWLAPGMGTFMGMSGDPSAESAVDAEMRRAGLFPLKIVETIGGKETTRFEATAVEATAVSDALFAIPAGFVKRPMLKLDKSEK